MNRHDNFDIDRRLATPGQEATRQVVRGLPEDTVSFAWRSRLNEELLSTAKKRRRMHFLQVWLARPALGLAVAGALAFVIVFNRTAEPKTAPSSSVVMEASLLAAHEEATYFVEVAGSGVNPVEIAYEASRPVEDLGWSEADIEAL